MIRIHPLQPTFIGHVGIFFFRKITNRASYLPLDLTFSHFTHFICMTSDPTCIESTSHNLVNPIYTHICTRIISNHVVHCFVHNKIKIKDRCSDIPLGGTHCLGDLDIQFAFTGGHWMRCFDEQRLTFPSTDFKIHDFLRGRKSSQTLPEVSSCHDPICKEIVIECTTHCDDHPFRDQKPVSGRPGGWFHHGISGRYSLRVHGHQHCKGVPEP
jgi:hypothetical protein